ncbi:GH25 family lysozyme [Faecalispora anaeroviscerum]|uniref:GH25 family lysozyme n=1 Tax=Faecalispora anaeroviscerum TaxID=2991836 RepID=UPI0024B885F3|nr:GH25 family lysozyme [Faecalispora anaeroviscerum]
MFQLKGLDVSKHNGVINWEQVNLAGYDFVLIRAGYGNSADQKDAQFDYNMKGAISRGMHIGAYWFNYCRSTAEAVTEAQVFKQILQPYVGHIDFPVSPDFEYDSIRYFKEQMGTDPTNALITQMMQAFIEEMKASGWFVNLYTNLDFIRSGRFSDELRNAVDLWLADYSGSPDFPCGIQQTGSTGKVPGISTNADIDVAYKDYPSIIRAASKNGLQPSAAPTPAKTETTSGIGVGTKVQYSGPLYADSYGNGEGKTVSGTFSVQRVISGRKCGILLPLGWVPASACKVPSAAATAPATSSKAVVKAGGKVQYSGPLYADSYGNGKGKTVSGTFAVQRVISGRKCGVLLPSGWVPESACKPV